MNISEDIVSNRRQRLGKRPQERRLHGENKQSEQSHGERAAGEAEKGALDAAGMTQAWRSGSGEEIVENENEQEARTRLCKNN